MKKGDIIVKLWNPSW